jgi:hypothetical protein
MDARAEKEARRPEEIARRKADIASREHAKMQAEKERRRKQAEEREARLASIDAARKSAQEAERARLEDEAWEEALRMSQEQADREQKEAAERAAAATKAAEPATEDEAWEEALRMSQEQADREQKEAEERAAAAGAMAAEKEVADNAIKLSVDEFIEDFSADNKAAHQKYSNSTLRLTGKVSRVVANEINNNYAVTLTGEKAGENLIDVRCKFGIEHADKVKQLGKGEKVTVQGDYAGVVVDINLRDCLLV